MKMMANHTELNVIDSGQGETALIFLHFWGGSSQTWNQVLAQLGDEYRCIRIDARGAGLSAAPVSGYSTHDHAEDTLAVIKALNLSRYIIIGHSMGGKAAQLIASTNPTGLQGVVLVASSPLVPMNLGDEQREMMRQAYASREAVNWTVENVLTADNITEEALEQLVQDATQMNPRAVNGWLDVGSKEDLHHVAASITAPVLIMAGELDKVDPVEVVKQHIAPAFPAAPVHILAGKGHLLPLEAPQQVAGLIKEFIQTRAILDSGKCINR